MLDADMPAPVIGRWCGKPEVFLPGVEGQEDGRWMRAGGLAMWGSRFGAAALFIKIG